VGLVVALIASVTGVGIGVVLPRAFPSPAALAANTAFALALLTLTSLHFIVACCHSPGRVHECVALPPRGAGGRVEEGAFEGWTFCSRAGCRTGKPPGAHHCSTVRPSRKGGTRWRRSPWIAAPPRRSPRPAAEAFGGRFAFRLRPPAHAPRNPLAPSSLPGPPKQCGFCVVELDHHCPFINNCVGRANQRAFIAFLACVCAACLYALAVCGGLVAAHWGRVAANVRAGFAAAARARRPPGAGGAGGGGPLPLLARTSIAATVMLGSSPWWLLAAYYLLLLCTGVLVTVGVLLGAQLKYLASGMTYIDVLKAGRAGGGGSCGGGGGGGPGAPPACPPPGLRARLREVMGGGGPAAWLVPRWEPPEGTLLAGGGGKKAI
jgi:hypothetical protein